MKRTLIRVLAAMLTLVMLVTALYVSPVSAAHTTTMQDYNTAAIGAPMLAYVPLDDRPVVCDRVQYAAVAAGFDIQFPPDKSWYQTHLDNQLVNEDDPRTQYTNEEQVGSGLRIMDWLDEMEADGCDYYIIHLDMMFSGGLVGSRYPDVQHKEADGRINISEQLEIAERLVTLVNNEDNHVYFIDTVMRLASTGGFKGFDGDKDYSAFRAYAEKARYPLTKDNYKITDYNASENLLKITMDTSTLFYFYSLDPNNWSKKITYDTNQLTQTDIDNYLLSRNRKLRLINYMIQYAPSACYIVGVDDSSPNNTIQSNEIKFIEARMEAMGVDYGLFADTDSLGLMATARCATDRYHGNNRPKVYVRYYGDREEDPADQYDTGTLSSNTEAHLACAGVEITDNENEADFEVLILTRINTSSTDRDPTHDVYKNNTSSGTLHINADSVTTYNNNIDALCAKANSNIASGKPTIVMDASSIFVRAYTTPNAVSGYTLKNLQDELLEKVEIGRLLGYSNWNTVGNTLGIAIGQGVSRYAYLSSEAPKTAAANIAAVQSITYSYIKDIVYNARHKNADYTWLFRYWIRNNSVAKTSDMNFYSLIKDDTSTSSKNNWEAFSGENVVNSKLGSMMKKGDDNSATLSDSYTDIINCLLNDEIYTDLSQKSNPSTCGIKTIELSRFRMPWYRIFEITFSIKVELQDVYDYSDTYLDVPLGTASTQFVETVKADKTVADDRKIFGEAHTYTDYEGSTYTLQPVGPSIYTEQLGAFPSVTLTREDTDNAYVGTGYKVTVKGTEYQTVVTGDVIGRSSAAEGDGVITTADAREVLRYVVGAEGALDTNAQQRAANIDGNDTIGSNDARRILQHALGLAA